MRRLFSPCRGARTSLTGRKCWRPRRLPARGRIGRHQRRCSHLVHHSSYTGCWPRRRWSVGWLLWPCVVRPPLWATSRPGREAHRAARPRTKSRRARLRTMDAAVIETRGACRTCGNSPERHRTCLVGQQSRRQVHQATRATWISPCKPHMPPGTACGCLRHGHEMRGLDGSRELAGHTPAAAGARACGDAACTCECSISR